jgi:hypothetical protein
MLKAPGTERLKLKYEEPPSKIAFKIDLCRYSGVRRRAPPLVQLMDAGWWGAGGAAATDTGNRT